MPTDWISHYGLREDPFADAGGDGPFLLTPQLNQRLNLLLHLVQYSELMLVVTGSRGSGKSTLLQRLLADAGPRWRPCVVEGDADLDPDALVARVVTAFDVPARPADAPDPMAVLQAFLQGLRKGSTQAVLLVDDAHLLPAASIDQLTRLAADRKRLRLAVVACGEPHLLERVVRSAGSGLLHVIDIPPLTEEQVSEYVELRLGRAGLKGRSPIGRDALHVLAKTGRGLPGLLNAAARQFLANRAEAGARGLRGLARATAKALARHRVAIAGAALGLGIVGGGTLWLLAGPGDGPAMDSAPVPITMTPSGSPRPPDAGPAPQPPPRAPRIEVVPPGAPPGARVPAVPPAPQPPAPPEPARASPPPAAASPDPVVAGAPSPATPPAPPSPTPPASATRLGDAPPPRAARPEGRGPDEAWLLAQPANSFTVQIFGSHDPRAAERFKAGNRLKDRTAMYRTSRGGKDWYVVVVGSYATREAAQRAVQGLPPEVKRNNPWPRNLATVQDSIRQAPPRD
jgi:DamX protein